MIKHGTRRYLNIDFSPVREELLKPESVAGFAQKGLDELEVKKLIEGFIDLFRRVAVSLPFYFVLGTICENASQRVLASSIKASLQAKEDSDFSKLFNAIWLVEADCEKGSGQLVSVVKTLPKAEFLRTYLVAHLITRVHWTHWKKPNRLALLDIADEVLKPLSRVNTEKGALTREVKSSDQREFRGEETKD